MVQRSVFNNMLSVVVEVSRRVSHGVWRAYYGNVVSIIMLFLHQLWNILKDSVMMSGPFFEFINIPHFSWNIEFYIRLNITVTTNNNAVANFC